MDASACDPPIESMAGGRTLLEITHLDPVQIILWQLVPFRSHLDPEDPRGIQPEDLGLDLAGGRPVAARVDQSLPNLEPPKRLDLPPRRAVPDRAGAPEHVVGANDGDTFVQDLRAAR